MSEEEVTPGLRRVDDLKWGLHSAVPHFTSSEDPVGAVSYEVTVDTGGKPQTFFRVSLLQTFGVEIDWRARLTEFLQSSIRLHLTPMVLSQYEGLSERGMIGLYLHQDY